MRTDHSNSLIRVHFDNKLYKNKAFHNQIKKVKQSFSTEPKTIHMVSNETGVSWDNVYQSVCLLRKSNQIAIAKFDICEVSKRRSTYLTTNSNLFPMSNMIKSVGHGK